MKPLGPTPMFTNIEIATMIAVFRLELEGEAYGTAIHDDLEGFIGRPVSLAAVYAALERLKRRGLVRATISSPLAVQGGRAKRLYELTRSGCILLKAEQTEAARIWHALPPRFNRSL